MQYRDPLYTTRPGQFFHTHEDGERIPLRCTRRKCGLCLFTLVCTICFILLIIFLLDHWGQLENIS